jgi:hypothetical protein
MIRSSAGVRSPSTGSSSPVTRVSKPNALRRASSEPRRASRNGKLPTFKEEYDNFMPLAPAPAAPAVTAESKPLRHTSSAPTPVASKMLSNVSVSNASASNMSSGQDNSGRIMGALSYAQRVTRRLSNRVSGKVFHQPSTATASTSAPGEDTGRYEMFSSSEWYPANENSRITSVCFGETDDDILIHKEDSDVVWSRSEIDMGQAWRQNCLKAKFRTLEGLAGQDFRATRRSVMLNEIGHMRVSR